MKGCKVARYHRPSHVHNRMPYLVSPQVIPGSPNPSRIASPTSCCLVTRSPLSVPPSYRPAGDWVPLGAPVRRWTSTGWGAVADMKEAKAAMDWRTAWTVRFWGLGLTSWARGRLPVALPTTTTAPRPRPLHLLSCHDPASGSESHTGLFLLIVDIFFLQIARPWETKRTAHHPPGQTRTHLKVSN